MKNKRYFGILVIVTTMLSTMVLLSCSHDDFSNNQEAAEQAANQQYAAAFVKAFGQVAPTVDWGFSSHPANARNLTRGVSTYASCRGNLQPTISFPTDCDDSNFLDAVPAGVNKLPTWGAGAGSYYIDAETQSVSTWSGASKIYVTGNVDLSDGDTDTTSPKFAPDYRSEIYVLEGASLKIGEASAFLFNVDAIYIAEGATFETTSFLKANSNTKIYNHGTFKAGTFEVNTSSFLYNVGTVEAGSINAESNASRVVNDGTITSSAVVVNAGAVQNNAEWTVTGTTEINSNNSGWVNNGHWTTYNYAYIGGSENVINNCFLEVQNDFAMNISSEQGAFKIDGGAGVLTKYFDGGRTLSGAIAGPFVITMGSEAVFVVEETAILESSRGDETGFGIFGPTTGAYAVFQAKNIVRDPYLESISSHGAVTYSGNLYVSAETHFAQGDDGGGNPIIYEKNGFSIADNIFAAGFNSGKPNITISQTPCNPGFIGATSTPLYRVIAEDLSASEAGDFDFNDVVFDIVKAEGGITTLRLICAGGVLPLRVMGIEVHGLFGETTPNDKGEFKMYNTGAGPTVDPVDFDVVGEYATPEQIRNIKIEVYKYGTWMELKATTGEAACKILVDDTFIPVPERKNIANEYLRFTDYVQGAFVDDFWWK